MVSVTSFSKAIDIRAIDLVWLPPTYIRYKIIFLHLCSNYTANSDLSVKRVRSIFFDEFSFIREETSVYSWTVNIHCFSWIKLCGTI